MAQAGNLRLRRRTDLSAQSANSSLRAYVSERFGFAREETGFKRILCRREKAVSNAQPSCCFKIKKQTEKDDLLSNIHSVSWKKRNCKPYMEYKTETRAFCLCIFQNQEGIAKEKKFMEANCSPHLSGTIFVYP